MGRVTKNCLQDVITELSSVAMAEFKVIGLLFVC